MARRNRRLFITLILSLLFIWVLLPYDNTLYLALRWNAGTATRSFTSTLKVLVAGRANGFQVAEHDIGTIVNTGWNPRAKLEAQLLTMVKTKTIEDVVVVADYESEGEVDFRGGKMRVHDVLASLFEDGFASAKRMRLYSKFKAALEAGDQAGMAEVSGKELDIIKHVPGLELGYAQMPSKKWYLMIDDDTYIHMPSLRLLLSTLDHRVPYYLGNAVGSYRSRFGHGGSAIVFSSAAMHKIFIANPQVVKQARKDSMTAEYGDEVVAKMAMRAGVYLSEQYNLHFNGEPPRKSFVRADRFCAAVVSFHKQTAEQITEDFKVLGEVQRPISWGNIGEFFDGPKVHDESGDNGDVRWDWDFVGNKEWDSSLRVIKKVKSSTHCSLMCKAGNCLAWRYEKATCSLAPWFTVGELKKGTATGLNRARIKDLMATCKK